MLDIKDNFPLLKNHSNLVYADSAASTQKPQIVIDKITQFYQNNYSNIHRGASNLSQNSTNLYEQARTKVAEFINAKSKEIIFTQNATHALNIITNGIQEQIKENDEILISIAEHHANLVPFQVLCQKTKAKLKYINLNDNYEIDIEHLKQQITKNTKIISISHISNVLGSINNIKEISKIAKQNNITLIIDASQSIAHKKIDIKELDCDYLFFSSHKMLGPSGVGILYGKYEKLNKLTPLIYGGSMIDNVSEITSTYQDTPQKFEAGTPNIEGAIGLTTAIEYLEKLTHKKIKQHEQELTKYFLEQIKQINGLTLFGKKTQENRIPLFSFTYKDIHPHDIGAIFNKHHIAIRVGTHCTIPLHDKYEVFSTARISLYIYNTKEDIDKIIEVLKNLRNDYEKGLHLV
jgi:cysteine desulfurase/selenocysteine lyase